MKERDFVRVFGWFEIFKLDTTYSMTAFSKSIALNANKYIIVMTVMTQIMMILAVQFVNSYHIQPITIGLRQFYCSFYIQV